MEKLRETKLLEKHIHEDLLGKIPIFFNQCVVKKHSDEGAKYQMVTISEFQTDQYRLISYHKVVSKII